MKTPAWACALHHADDIPRSKRKRDLCEDCYDGLVVRGLAWCSKGKHRVDASAMLKDGKMCCKCNASRAAAYYAANREKSQAQVRAYRAAHRERVCELARAYRVQNRDRVNATAARYRRRHRTAIHERQHRYYWSHRTQEIARTIAWRAANQERQAHYSRVWLARKKLAILHSWRRAA